MTIYEFDAGAVDTPALSAYSHSLREDFNLASVTRLRLRPPEPNPSRSTARRSGIALLVLDTLSVILGIAVAGIPWALLDRQGRRLSAMAPLRTELPYVVLYLAAFSVYGLYRRERRRLRHDWFVDAPQLFHACAAAAIGTMFISAFLSRGGLQWRSVHAFEAATVTCCVFFTVGASRSLRAGLQARRGVARARVVVVGLGAVARRVAASLGSFDDVHLIGFVDDPLDDGGRGLPVLGTISDLDEVCRVHTIDRVIVAVSDARTPAVVDALRTLPHNVQVSVVPRLYELITPRSTIQEVHGINLIDVAPPSVGRVQLFLKRAIDIAGSLALLTLLSPVMLACAIAIRATSPGPALFKQRRAGRNGKPFTVLKFRSMREGAEHITIDLRDQSHADGPLFKLVEDPRVTAVGRFLRATSLDELPQLLNVLVGHMSLVGPRPFILAEAQEIDGWAAKRFAVRPGMTGLWQVSGRSDLPFEDLRHLDYAYVSSWSLWWDLRILAKTPPTVFARRGAY